MAATTPREPAGSARPAGRDTPAESHPPAQRGPVSRRQTRDGADQSNVAATAATAARRPARASPRRRAPVLLAAAVATCWAAILSATPVAAAIALTQVVEAPRVSLSGVVRYGLAGWLLGHGVPLRTGSGMVGLAPLVITALAAWRVARAGVHTTRAIGGRRTGRLRFPLVASIAVAVVYALLGAGAGVVAEGPGLGVSPLRAGLTLGVFGLVSSLAGALRVAGVGEVLAARLPAVPRDAARTGLVAGLLVLAAGTALAGLAVALAGRAASDTLAAYHTGVAGQAGITLLCLAYLPNLGVWGASYLLGPGFSVGSGTIVRASEVSLGALPALPVFAGLPSAPLPGAGGLLAAVPLGAGLVAGWLLARRRIRAARHRRVPWPGLLGSAVLAGPVGGVLLGLAGYASGGPLGAGRLATVGPVPWQVAAIGSGVLAAGTLCGALATRALIGTK